MTGREVDETIRIARATGRVAERDAKGNLRVRPTVRAALAVVAVELGVAFLGWFLSRSQRRDGAARAHQRHLDEARIE